jgi:protein-disulfide isomerase
MLKLAAKVKLDTTRFKADMTGNACKAKLARHRTEMATLGVNGTPGIFINGKFYVGPRTPEGMKAVIDKEIAAANAALRKGVKLEQYYESLFERGKRTI